MKINNIYYILLLIIVVVPTTTIAWASEVNEEKKININNYSSSLQPSSSPLVPLNETNVDFSTNIEYIKGHLSAAISNKQAGNNELVQTHSFHPITEIYTLIRDQLSSADTELNKTLINSLNNLTSIVYTSTPAEFTDSATSVKNLLDKAIVKVIPANEIADIRFNMSTLINLLKTAESEYGIGIENGTITNIAEYQDAQGFISSANELFNKTITNMNQTMDNKFSEVKSSIEQLNTIMTNKEDAKQISTTTNNISNTIPKILNIQAKDLAVLVSTERDASEIIDNIRNLLNQSIENVNSGDYQNAESLVIAAYLDNFEFIEGDIAKHDESLMKDTEVLLREQLRSLIQERASIEDIQNMINTINSKLNEIEKLLE
jgi:hypothetical protein